MPNAFASPPAHPLRRLRFALAALAFGLATAPFCGASLQVSAATSGQSGQPASRAPDAAREACLKFAASPPDYSALGRDAYQRAADDWAARCRAAIAEGDADPRLKTSLARALPHERRAEEVALLREALAQGDGEAGYLLYESHNSWDQRLDRAPMIGRQEADLALRRSAELGHPEGRYRLTILLDRGGVVKRDPAAARFWAERTLEKLPAGTARGDVEALLGRLLAGSDQPAERARGLDLLQRLSRVGQFGAKTGLAAAIRRDDPVRARALLEEALRPDPGGAIPLLAQMLSSGEGGPADLKRAIRLVTSRSDIGAISGVQAEFILDGRLPPRDVGRAIALLRHAAVWDYEAQLRLLRLLPQHPEVALERPERLLYDAVIAAELDEPGARDALLELRLSRHPQFRDRAEGCKLLQAAVQRGDPAAAALLPECSAL